jgi:hypothetical protein
MTVLCIGLNNLDGKIIPHYGCGQMDKYGWCFIQRNMKALFDMLTKNWAIMGFDRHITCSKCTILTRYANTCLAICFVMYGL